MRSSLFLLLLALLCACACAEPASVAPPDRLENGVYEILAVEPDARALPAPGPETRVMVHDHQYVQGGAELPPDHVLLRVPGHAPLDLGRPPTQGESNGRAVLLLQLEPVAGEALAKLTARAEWAAVVVGGRIVTVHRIRVPIEGGGLQVSC